MNSQQILERYERFNKELELPVAVFARKIGITARTVYSWRHGQLKLGDKTLARIDAFLSKLNY